jgi:hypothetical protein
MDFGEIWYLKFLPLLIDWIEFWSKLDNTDYNFI